MGKFRLRNGLATGRGQGRQAKAPGSGSFENLLIRGPEDDIQGDGEVFVSELSFQCDLLQLLCDVFT